VICFREWIHGLVVGTEKGSREELGSGVRRIWSDGWRRR
jgi:hypothetical protein